jgi:ABC-type Fe3+ transport system permease subunit
LKAISAVASTQPIWIQSLNLLALDSSDARSKNALRIDGTPLVCWGSNAASSIQSDWLAQIQWVPLLIAGLPAAIWVLLRYGQPAEDAFEKMWLIPGVWSSIVVGIAWILNLIGRGVTPLLCRWAKNALVDETRWMWPPGCRRPVVGLASKVGWVALADQVGVAGVGLLQVGGAIDTGHAFCCHRI